MKKIGDVEQLVSQSTANQKKKRKKSPKKKEKKRFPADFFFFSFSLKRIQLIQKKKKY
jgi:hypothetical protein